MTLSRLGLTLVAVVLAGLFQVAMGVARAGLLGYFFPSSVIKGMLVAIGLIIILKQIPHAFGYDEDYEGDLSSLTLDASGLDTSHFPGNYDITLKRGTFKAWTALLAIFAFALSLLGTFLVRSGVLTSVHAFAESDFAKSVSMMSGVSSNSPKALGRPALRCALK